MRKTAEYTIVTDADAFQEILNDTCELVKQAAKGKGRTITVSPEVAAQLDRIEVVPPAPEMAEQTPVPPAPADEKAKQAPAPSPPTRKKVELPVVPAPSPPDAQDVAELAALEEKVRTCTQCRLSETRTQTVFGDGHPGADLVFVGEAPGADEDAQGKPFVGRAGGLLTDIIKKGMQIERGDVYICNVLKCRPPGNRDPRQDEKDLCEPYLVRQLELLKPKVICALGTHAAQTLLKVDTSIGRLRGKWHFYHGIPLRATYHPAYLLRSPGEKPKTWQDIQAVMRLLAGKEHPEPPSVPTPPETPDLFA